MNIFLHELKSYRKSTFIWTTSLIAIVLLFLSLYPSFSSDIEDFNKMLEGFPEPVRKAFGIQIGSMGTLLGFYSYSFLYITLCGAIQSMNLGLSIVSKEVQEKTADFLLTKPVSRTKILTSKLIAAVTSLVITNIFYLIAVIIMSSQITNEEFSMKVLLLISISLFFVQLIFLALGILLSVLIQKMKSVLTFSLGTVFCFFFIGMIAATGEDEIKRYLSPFKYFDTVYIMENSSYETSFLLTGIGVILVSIITSYIFYRKNDVHSV